MSTNTSKFTIEMHTYTYFPFSQNLSSENVGEMETVVLAHISSLLRVKLIESFRGKISFSSRFPPEKTTRVSIYSLLMLKVQDKPNLI